MLDDPSIHSWPILWCCVLVSNWRTETHISFLKHCFPFCFSSDQSSTPLHFQQNEIQVVLLAFTRLQICLGFYLTLQPYSSNLAMYALFLNILHITHAYFSNRRCPCYFSLFMQNLPLKPISGSTWILSVSSVYVNPLQCLQPLSSGVFAIIPLVHNAQQHCHTFTVRIFSMYHLLFSGV